MSKSQNIAIIGLGLMGGSLGLALRGRSGIKVTGYARRLETRQASLEMGILDEVFDSPQAAVRDACLAVICLPVSLIAPMVETCSAAMPPQSIITDVGSSKADLVKQMDFFLQDKSVRFVGSHPIAGSERQGLDSARADLYDEALVVLTPSAATDPAALATVSRFWQSLNSRVFQLAPETHDELLASTSHLPHLIAAVLAGTVGRHSPEQIGVFCGSGFRDTTRIADGSPDMWHDIIKSNRSAVLCELLAFKERLDELILAVSRDDLAGVRDFLAAARHSRRDMLLYNRAAKK